MIDPNALEGKRVFIIGNGDRELYAKAERTLYKIGARYVLNPIEHFADAPSVPEYNRRTLHMLTSASPKFDALVLLDGWSGSLLANACDHAAKLTGITVSSLLQVERMAIRKFWEYS